MATLDQIRDRTAKGTQLFAWMAVTSGGAFDKNVCSSPTSQLSNGHHARGCVGHHLQKQTMEAWRSDGLPGSAPTVCGSLCRCVLIPAGVIDIRPDTEFVDPVDLEAAKKDAERLPVPKLAPDWLSAFLTSQHAAALRIVAIAERVGITRTALLTQAKQVAAGAHLTADHLRQALAELQG